MLKCEYVKVLNNDYHADIVVLLHIPPIYKYF